MPGGFLFGPLRKLPGMSAYSQIIVPKDFCSTSIPASGKDIDILARTIFGEARSEIWEGQIAVAWAIRNRVVMDLWSDKKRDWWGEGWAEVCLKKWQFTCWQDHNRELMIAVTLDDAAYAQCQMAALSVVKGLFPDNTWGSTFYLNPKAVEKMPTWSFYENGKPRTPHCVIGNHHFYAGIEPGDPLYKSA